MDGKLGATSLGNTQLVAYGIQTEESDIRVHVCPQVRRVYVYPTECGMNAILTGKYIEKPGYQKGIETPTATGYIVPPFDIRKCSSIKICDAAWKHIKFSPSDSLAEKGRKAEKLVRGMLKHGLLPVPMNGRQVTDEDIQKLGQDILVIKGHAIDQEDIRIQVKCDYPGGEKHLGGTGNLFLQVSECNPLRIY